MTIDTIRANQIVLSLEDGRDVWADGIFVDAFDSIVVEIVTEDGKTVVG